MREYFIFSLCLEIFLMEMMKDFAVNTAYLIFKIGKNKSCVPQGKGA